MIALSITNIQKYPFNNLLSEIITTMNIGM